MIQSKPKRLTPALATDHAKVLWLLIQGKLRWEFFPGSATHGELCYMGMRYATELDAFGCPMLHDVLREVLPKRLT